LKILNKNTDTLIHSAMRHGKANIGKFLIEFGFDVNLQRTSDGITPIFLAVQGGFYDCVQLLIDSSANVNASAVDDGITPLMICSK